MLSLWNVYWKTLRLSSVTFEAIRTSQNGFWLSLRLFILIALIVSSTGLIGIFEVVTEPTLAERIDVLARHVEDVASLAPWILGDLLDQVVQVIDQVVAELVSFQPPLGVRPSRLLRLLGDWLQTPLSWLSGWLSLGLLTWVIGRLMGGKSGIREHLSLLFLAASPLILFLPVDIIVYTLEPGVLVSYLIWAFKLIIWVWCAAILVKALSIAHSFPIDHAVATVILSWSLILASSMVSIALVIILLLNLF